MGNARVIPEAMTARIGASVAAAIALISGDALAQPDCAQAGACSGGWHMPRSTEATSPDPPAAEPAAASGPERAAPEPVAPEPARLDPAGASTTQPFVGYAAPAPPHPYGRVQGWHPNYNYGTQAYPYVPSAPDQATEPEKDPPFFDIAAGTQFPLGLGPQLTLELPARILLQADVAWMPAAYGSAINAFIETFGKEGAVVGPVIEEALADSFVFRASGGWRPFTDYGFEITGGYTLIKVAGEAPAEVVADIADDELEDQIEEAVVEPIAFDSTLHNFHVAVGWRFLALEDHLVIRANLGYTQTVGSSTSAELDQFPELETQLNPVIDRELNRILTRDIKLPLLGVNAGYRF